MMTSDERELAEALREIGGRPSIPADLAARVARSHERRRRITLGLTAVAALAVGLGTTFVGFSIGSSTHDDARIPALAAGDATRVAASGHVALSVDGRGKFCPIGGPLVARYPSPPSSCEGGVPVIGVEYGKLANRYSRNGIRFGDAWLAGTLKEGVLHVDEQDAPRPIATSLPDVQVPCTPPPAGWPDDETAINIDGAAVANYQRQHPSEVVAFSTVRPAKTQAVLVVAAADVKSVESALRTAYPGRLCVVESRYTASEVDTAQHKLNALIAARAHGLSGSADVAIGPAGQPIIRVDTLIDTEEQRNVLSQFPADLVQLTPWLQPIRAGQ